MNQSKVKYTELTSLPNSFITEQALLNILLNNPFLIKKIIGNLKIETFYFEPHRILYQLLYDLAENNKTITLTTIISTLQDKELLNKIGGIERIILIMNRFENFADIEEYIKILNEKYTRRLIIEVGKQIIAWGYLTTMELEEILERSEKVLLKINQEKLEKKIYSVAEVTDEIFLEMNLKVQKTKEKNLFTSFLDLDSILQGFENSDLIIIAGRPSMGKTAFSLNLGKNIVENYKIPLIIFSLEMSRQQILYRLISTQSKITISRLKTGKMTLIEWQQLSASMKYISNLPIFIDDNPNITLLEIRSKIRKIFQNKNKNGLVIIDYLQLMKVNFKLENRVQEISHITRNLKILAKEFNVPIIVLSQLSRGLESRVNKRPMLSDLRESGCLNTAIKTKKINSWGIKNSILSNSSTLEFKGIKPTYLLIFENDQKISLTSNHRILSEQGWIKISQINSTSKFYCLIHNKSEDVLFKYSKIKNIRYDGLNKVYERTIPVYHNYFYENFIMHNSIEQDADIVIMLYREDYYNDKKQNNQITELIVAKHRNGPIGTARLFFNPYITSFKNITVLKE